MKFIKYLIAGTIILSASLNSHAQNLGNLLSGVIEGVFTKSDLTVADIVGEYQAEGPAVTFKSDNLLQKAGGIAGAATIESKLNPYYEQYGLNNMVLTVTEDGGFTMKIKSMNLKGTLTANQGEGTFDFKFNVLGINLGAFTAYVEKSGNTLKLMFDATKLKSFISTVAKLTGNTMATTLGSILDSYDGACIGWKMKCTSAPENNNSGDALSNGLGTLKDILNKGK